jgi:signal transduction histidine kinase
LLKSLNYTFDKNITKAKLIIMINFSKLKRLPKFSTIHGKLSAVLISFSVITILISFISFNCIEKTKGNLSEIKEDIDNTYTLLLEDAMVTHDFYNYETINSKFFETGKSELLNKHYKICSIIDSSLIKLASSQKKFDFELDTNIKQVRTEFFKYRASTDTIIRYIKELGFKDYGVEGEMRNYAHKLEKYNEEIGLVNILQLRRNEKDFIIRQEKQYIIKYLQLYKMINVHLKNDNSIIPSKKKEIIFVLNNYSEQFLRLANYSEKIGLKNQAGVKKRIDGTTHEINLSFKAMAAIATQKEKSGISQIKTIFMFLWAAFICLSIIVSLSVSKKVSRSITHLKEKIAEFVKSDFTERVMLPIKDSKYEVDILRNNFSIMEQQIVNQISALKQTNKELEMFFWRSGHDIKGPLATVKGLTNLANSEISDPLALKYFSMVDQCWQKLTHVVDELGLVADIKSESTKTETINFEEVCKSTFREYKYMADFEKIIFSVNINCTETFYSDQKLIKTIFRQLFENSIKYSNKTGIPFVKVSIANTPNNMIKIIVSDNGMGIKKEYHTKIFDMFFRGTNKVKGTGLGLFIIQNSLQKLNGAISLESEEGKGTTFSILLPNKIEKKNIGERIIQKREIALFNSNMMLNYI